MRGIFVIFCIVLLAISGVMGCKPPGLPCSSDADCCGPLICNPWAGRCTKKMGPNQPDDSQSPTNNKQQ
ncbi:U-reduvitoxin-Pr5a [Megachile rotundata]|uniref:U-reduvitoxin-Pr5a n=1 Tax=Megachile rotundata TaxID=143995 RepID=UPI000615181D|nr:PREDICTED: uncharacterized protein LOC105664301 [Megachile rotundata]XP_012153598.1 PREDICTED: uncharacterized protein LOC105664301 [Megachile rotundata]